MKRLRKGKSWKRMVVVGRLGQQRWLMKAREPVSLSGTGGCPSRTTQGGKPCPRSVRRAEKTQDGQKTIKQFSGSASSRVLRGFWSWFRFRHVHESLREGRYYSGMHRVRCLFAFEEVNFFQSTSLTRHFQAIPAPGPSLLIPVLSGAGVYFGRQSTVFLARRLGRG